MTAAFPTLRGHWLYGHVRALRFDPVATLERLHRETGPNFVLDMRLMPLPVLGQADAARHVLVTRASNYRDGASRANRMLRGALGDSVLTTDGARWERLRRSQQPAFRRNRLDPLADTIVARFDETIDGWARRAGGGDDLPAFEALVHLMASAGLDGMFGFRPTESDTRMLAEFLTRGQRWLWTNLLRPIQIPARFDRGLRRCTRKLEALAERVLAEGHGGELLRCIVELDGTDREEVLAQLRTFIVAAPENPANTMAWALVMLARRPDIEARLVEEVHAVLEDRNPCLEDLPRMPYTAQVVAETLRMFPTAWILDRTAIAPDEIMGHRVRAGQIVAISPYLVHRDPAHWPRPEHFDPERFTPERIAARPKHHYIPYGAGRRNCIGSHLATMQLRLALPMLVRRFRFELASAEPVRAQAGPLLRPEGLRFRLHPRPRSDRARRCA